jgi:hypothetical protein
MNKLLQRFDALAFGCERRISPHPLRNFQRVGGVELTVQVSVDEQNRVVVGRRFTHRCFPIVPSNSLVPSIRLAATSSAARYGVFIERCAIQLDGFSAA